MGHRYVPPHPDGDLLDDRQASRLLGITEPCLRQWRSRGQGPAWLKLTPHANGVVRYRRADVLAFLENSLRTPTKGFQRAA